MPDPINPFLTAPHPAYWANQKNAYPEMTSANYTQMYDEKPFLMNPNPMLSNNGFEARLPEDMNQSGNLNDWYERADSVPQEYQLFSNFTNPPQVEQLMTQEGDINTDPLGINGIPENGSTSQGFMFPDEVTGLYGTPSSIVTFGRQPTKALEQSTEAHPILYDKAANNALIGIAPLDNTSNNPYVEQLMTQEGDINTNPLGINEITKTSNTANDITPLQKDENNNTYVDGILSGNPTVMGAKPFNPDIIKMDNKGVLNQPIKMPGTGPLPPNNSKFNIENPYMKNKPGVAEAYYMAKAGLDATALIGNMIQPQPPSLQMKMPHYERMRLDRTPFEEGRSDIKEQANQAYRYTREGISQASDLMKGLSAITSGTQQNLQQLAVQEAGAEQQVKGQNQQIAMQETGQQVDTMNQEAAMNYQIQQQAQQFKDQQVAGALAGLTNTGAAYAKYNTLKDFAEKQDKITKESALSNTELQSTMLKFQMTKNEMDSDEYKLAKSNSWKESIKNVGNEMISDEKYKELQPIYGSNASDKYLDWFDRAQDEDFNEIQYNIKEFEKEYPQGQAPVPTGDVKADEQALNRYNAKVATYNLYKDDPKHKYFDTETKYWRDVRGKLNQTEHDATFSERYKKERGLLSMDDFISNVDAITNRTRQSLI